MNLRTNRYLLLLMAVFGIVYSLISIVNHYNFQTYALDLGAYTNALFDYIHFQWNDSSVFMKAQENLLADHFDLYLILFSPLALIFGTYTLLIVQIFFVLLGGLGVYKYFLLKDETHRFALSAALYFYVFFGIFSAISSDYHSNVIAAALVPWFFYLLKQGRIWATSLMLLLILVSKENVSLWMAFVCLGLIIEYRKDEFWRNYLILSSLVCLVYFVLITSVVMPWISNNSAYSHFCYSYLGGNSMEALMFFFKHPVEAFEALFINQTNDPSGDYVKAELHILLLISGLPLLILKPQYIFMLIPVYFQKLYHDNNTVWGVNGQYCVEFAPLFAIGIFSAISEYKSRRIARLFSVLVLIGAFWSTIRIMDSTISYSNKSKIRIYQESHYFRNYDVGNVYRQLSKIPANAIVSSQSPFLPHLSFRDNIYQFPMIKNAAYIVYSDKESSYPIDKNSFSALTAELENSGKWSVLYKDADLTILFKKD